MSSHSIGALIQRFGQIGLLRAIVLALVGAAALTACGGGGSGGAAPLPAAATPEGRALPPDPGAAAAASLVGVDVNANGVRDEVERSLSQSLVDDAQYKATLAAARAYQRLLIDAPPKSRVAALAVWGRISCAGSDPNVASSADGSLLVQLTFDTVDRRAVYAQAADMTEGGYEASELPPCQ